MADISQVRVNNTDYNFADDTKVPYDLLQDTVGFTSKNLIPFPYKATVIENGVTFTVNNDGSITANGTSTGNCNIKLFSNITVNTLLPSLIGEKVILSGGKSNAKRMQLWTNNAQQITDSGNGITFTWPDLSLASSWNLTLFLEGTGITYNNETFYPMLRKADIMDDTFEQYNPSVKQIFRNNKIIEGKNLLEYPYHETTKTKSGITFTVNADGSVTVNGTSTAQCTFQLDDWDFHINNLLKYKGQQLIITGCPSGGSNTTYSILVQGLMQDGIGVHDYGNGVSVTPADFSGFTNTRQICIMIRNGVTVNNLVFKPMVRLATETDPTYEQYYIPGVVTQEAQNILGAKNLLPYPFRDTTLTRDGITFTDNGDGSITLNGTATQGTNMELFGNTKIYNDMSFRLSGCSGGSNTTYWLALRIGKDSDDSFVASLNEYNNEDFIYQAGRAKNDEHMRLMMHIESGVTLNNVKIWPMMRPLSVNDNTYTPYAMTNRELTEKVTIQKIATAAANQTFATQMATLYTAYQTLTAEQKFKSWIGFSNYGTDGIYNCQASNVAVFSNVSIGGDTIGYINLLRLNNNKAVKIRIGIDGTVTYTDISETNNGYSMNLYVGS